LAEAQSKHRKKNERIQAEIEQDTKKESKRNKEIKKKEEFEEGGERKFARCPLCKENEHNSAPFTF
jgi:hypothetical protein